MSALGGFWSWAGPPPGDAARAILTAQAGYGPHDLRFHDHEGISLGRALYKSLPEDEFDCQPLVGGGGRYVLAADLRLDNRDELLAAMNRDCGGRHLSDAAILLMAFERWGEAILDRVIGDFAFALWDRDERRLLLARDPTGQRPLHYHRAPGFVAFSSLAKGLHALPSLPRRPDARHLAEFIGLVPTMGSGSCYADVKRVRPGHVLTVTQAGMNERRYWTPQLGDGGFRRMEDWRDAFRSELDRAVRVRMRGAGSRLGAHLSGGWDSSAVAATAAKLASPGCEVLAFTAVPAPDAEAPVAPHRLADEGAIAAETASLHASMQHRVVPGRALSPIADLDGLLRCYDRPLATLCNHVWMAEIRSLLRESGAHVLLTGELGNWSISASPHSILSQLIRERRWSAWAREAIALGRTGGARWRGVALNSIRPWLPSRYLERLRPLSRGAATSAYTALHPAWQAHVASRREQLAVSSAAAGGYRGEVVEALLRYDFGNFRKGALAGWGVDERDPTSDRRLIEFCLSMPLEMLLKNGQRRPLARAALSDRLPRAVLDEKRKGYQAADWHLGLTRDLARVAALVEEIAADDLAASLIDVEALRLWIREWPDGGWGRPQVAARYRVALLTALSAGHFIISARS